MLAVMLLERQKRERIRLDPGKAPRIRSRIVRTKIATSMARDRKLAVSQGLVGYTTL